VIAIRLSKNFVHDVVAHFFVYDVLALNNYALKERIETDQIILAVGYTTDLSFIDPEWSLNIDGGLIVADQESQRTNIPGVFAGGSVTSGPGTVIEAIAAGKRAAFGIDSYFKRAEARAADKGNESVSPLLRFNSEYLKKTSRVTMPKRSLSERSIDVEDAHGLSLSEVETEANRCFNCGCVGVIISDLAVALIALDAKIKISGTAGERALLVRDFFDTWENTLKPDEIITEIQVPRPPDRAKQTFLKFRLRKAVDFAIVSVASVIVIEEGMCKDARVVLGAVAPKPIRLTEVEEAIKGEAINATTAEKAAQLAVIGSIPLSKNAYKVEITKALVKKALLC